MLRFIFVLVCTTIAVELFNYENMIHYGKVGFAQQEINVLFDTGSSLTWVASVDCKTCGSRFGAKFDQYTSKTIHYLNRSFEIEYGSGSIRGELALETIEIDSLLLTNVEIGVVLEEVGYSFKQLPINGIIALAPGQVSASVPGRLGSEKNLTCIEIVLSESIYESGSLKLFESYSINKEKTLTDNKWTVELDKLIFGQLNFCTIMGGCNAVIDTGTSLLILPKKVYKEVNKKYRLQSDCSNFAQIPDLEIELSQRVYELSGDSIIVYDQGVCTLAFMQLDLFSQSSTFIVLGGTFIRNSILILDFSSDSLAVRPKFPIFGKNKLIPS